MKHYSYTKSFASLTITALLLQLVFPLVSYAEDLDVAPPEEVVEEIVQTDLDEEQIEEVQEQILEPEDTEQESDEPVDTEPNIDELTGTSSIKTGDATAASALKSEVNTTKITTENASTTDTSTSTEPAKFTFADTIEPELEVSSTNTATTTNNATTTANTGVNRASGGSATITTGDAIAYTDVLNVVNTNIVDSDGLVAFMNETLGYEDFNLQDDFADIFEAFLTAESTPSCEGECGSQDLTVNATNTASIINNIVVGANTGGNTAHGRDTNINTGSAYASANVINVANTNITDSQYLLLVFNNFSDYSGDIVLPNSEFFNRHFSHRAGVGTNASINNNAQVTNNNTVVANTGNNSGGNINTGNAFGHGDVMNTINQNIIGGGSFNMLIRVHGDWSGEVTGLPDGMSWRMTARGIEITSAQPGDRASGGANVTTSNTANIQNDVKVFALTGDNHATGDGDITTGNAYADSSIMNIANTNVISSNWSNLIFTIFGDWDGNLAFGQSDLWLGIQAHSEDNPIMPGSEIEYTFTVFNHGDVTARNVQLESTFNSTHLNFGSDAPRVSLGDIEAGGTREFSHRGVATNALPPKQETAVPLQAVLSSDNNDANEEDNEDEATVYVGNQKKKSNSTKPRFPASVEISKIASQSTAQVGDVVNYSIELFNHGGQLYDALLVDTLYGPEGEVVIEQSWPLDTVHNWETVNIGYELTFTEELSTGTYTNVAQVVGFHTSARPDYQIPYQSELAEATVQFGPQQLVLGASTCPQYLTEYMKFGKQNSVAEVQKLQIFLNEHMSSDIEETGFFDLQTEIAVRDFQIKYRSEILDPWGISADTGHVYFTTQKKINEIMCEGRSSFPLSLQQKNEIDLYRANKPFGFARIRSDED